jgi:CheY-like chemotaxis protein
MSKPKVLVVDDDPVVLHLVAYALSSRGFEVYALSSPVQALQLTKTILYLDMLVSDVNMLEMSGPELVTKIKQVCPTVAVVMMSADLAGPELPGGVGFIGKPFTLTDLYSVVEKALARSLT